MSGKNSAQWMPAISTDSNMRKCGSPIFSWNIHPSWNRVRVMKSSMRQPIRSNFREPGNINSCVAFLQALSMQQARGSSKRGYFWLKKYGVNGAILRLIGQLSLLHTWMTPQDQYGGMLFFMLEFMDYKMSSELESTKWWAVNVRNINFGANYPFKISGYWHYLKSTRMGMFREHSGH